MKFSLLVVIIAAAAGSCTEADAPATPRRPAQVVEVPDGDSLKVRIDGTDERVRLIGVNAPESDECFGKESAAGLQNLLDEAEVEIVTDFEERDQYGRLLAYVYLEGSLINEEIARRGLVVARAYEPNTTLQADIDAAADDARQNQRGMWAPTVCASSAATGVEVTGIDSNPRGPDQDNLNGERVFIANRGNATVDLGGWILRDSSSVHRYLFPTGTTLAPDSDIVVHTGCGSDTSERRYWCADGPVWDNSGDTAFLLDAEGRTVSSFDY